MSADPDVIRLEQLREADFRFEAERDKRYEREAALRAEALKIKEEADRVALSLARENQVLKEVQHNGAIDLLKDTVAHGITREVYDERHEALIHRVADLERGESGNAGRVLGTDKILAWLVGAAGVAVAIASQLH